MIKITIIKHSLCIMIIIEKLIKAVFMKLSNKATIDQ